MISSVRFDQQMARLPSERLSLRSITALAWPRAAKPSAAARPTGPAPTITTGWCAGCSRSWSADRICGNTIWRGSVMEGMLAIKPHRAPASLQGADLDRRLGDPGRRAGWMHQERRQHAQEREGSKACERGDIGA